VYSYVARCTTLKVPKCEHKFSCLWEGGISAIRRGDDGSAGVCKQVANGGISAIRRGDDGGHSVIRKVADGGIRGIWRGDSGSTGAR